MIARRLENPILAMCTTVKHPMFYQRKKQSNVRSVENRSLGRTLTCIRRGQRYTGTPASPHFRGTNKTRKSYRDTLYQHLPPRHCVPGFGVCSSIPYRVTHARKGPRQGTSPVLACPPGEW